MAALSTTYGPQIWRDFIVSMGAVPVVNDLQREDAYLLLQNQALDLIVATVNPLGPGTGTVGVRAGNYQSVAANSDVKASYTTEVQFNTAAGAQLLTSFPAGSLNIVQRTVRIRAWGVLTSNGTPTFIHTIRLGTTNGIAGGIINQGLTQATGASAAGAQWFIEGMFVVKIVGNVANNVQPSIEQSMTSDATTRVIDASPVAIGPGTLLQVDLTSALIPVITTTCSASDALNTDTLLGCIVDIVR